MDDTYTNRELDDKLKNLEGNLRELRDDENEKYNDTKVKLGEILAQTKMTNGRVSALERFQWILVGGLSVVTTIIIPLLFLFLKGKM